MQFLSAINNPFLKLIYLEIYQKAIKNKGLITKEELEDVCLNLNYKPIFELMFPEDTYSLSVILSKLTLLKKVIKAELSTYPYKLNTKQVGQYFFMEAYQQSVRESWESLVLETGFDPLIFIRSALQNVKRAKSKTFQFNSLDDVVHYYFEEKRINDKNVIQDLRKENKMLMSSNPQPKTEKTQGFYVEKLFDVKLIYETMLLKLEDKDLKRALWYNLEERLLREGKTKVEIGKILGKLFKEYPVDILEKAFKLTSPNILNFHSAFIYNIKDIITGTKTTKPSFSKIL